MVLTPEGKISHYFYGIEFRPRDLRLGLVEASRRQIGTPIDQVTLLCFHYDPKTGKYTPAVMTFVRLGGLVTIVALGTLLGACGLRAASAREDRADKRPSHPPDTVSSGSRTPDQHNGPEHPHA